MTKFKSGDRVRKKNGDTWGLGSATWGSSTLGTATYDVVTVDYLRGSEVFAKETGTYMMSADLELVDNTQRKRDELEAALLLINSYRIGVSRMTIGHYWHDDGTGDNMRMPDILNLILPLPPIKSAQQVEIERIETEMRKLADDLAKTKS